MSLLEEQSEVQVIEYLKEGLTLQEVQGLHTKLGIDNAIEMIRPKEAEFKLAGLHKGASNDEIFAALIEYPKLLERPIVVKADRAVIARPPENLLSLL